MTIPLLLLAGFDPSGGAGILADAATARACGCYPLGVPTTLTIQNSLHFESADPVATTYIERAVAMLAAEFSFDTAKAGLVPVDDAAWLERIGDLLRRHCRRIVIDPVLRPTAGVQSIAFGSAYLSFLAGTVVTPNHHELALLAKAAGVERFDVAATALALAEYLDGTTVVTYEGSEPRILVADREGTTDIPITLVPLDRPVHGTGCRFSTALACSLAQGKSLPDAVADAAAHLTAALQRREHFHPDGQEFILSE